MDFSDKIKKILELEDINLKEFSELAGIHYQTAKQYKGGTRSPSYPQIQKIASIPQFSKYKELLLSVDKSIHEVPLSSSHANEVREPALNYDPLTEEALLLFRRLQELGRGDEALAVLRAIEQSAKKK